MERFNYTVQDAVGTVSTGVLASEDEDCAVQSLQAKGLFILSIQPENVRSGSVLNLRKLGAGGEVTGRELVFFGEQMATLLGGGVPLVRALSLLSEQPGSKTLGLVLSSVTKDVSSGVALHKAMDKHPKVFDEIWVSLVQAGEVSGQLPVVLRQITAHCESRENIKSKIMTALAYPAGLMVVSLCVLTYFIIHIVPIFADIFRDFNLELPLITRMTVAFSGVITNYLVLLIVAVIGGFLSFRIYIATAPGRLTLNHIQFNLPLFGDLMFSMQLERMLTTMATLIRSGVSILTLLSVLKNAFKKNLIIQNALSQAIDSISGGRSISESFKRTGVFPSMVTEMMRMGEESGKLPDSVVVLSKYYQEQIDQFIRRFAAVIDPVLVIGVGAIIGVIVMSIFMPIFQLSQIGGG